MNTTSDKIRLNLDNDEYNYLNNLMNNIKSNDENHLSVKEKLAEKNIIKYSEKKREAMKIAIKKRGEIVKDKIIFSVEQLRISNLPITPYSVAKNSGVSYNTVKKYEQYFI